MRTGTGIADGKGNANGEGSGGGAGELCYPPHLEKTRHCYSARGIIAVHRRWRPADSQKLLAQDPAPAREENGTVKGTMGREGGNGNENDGGNRDGGGNEDEGRE